MRSFVIDNNDRHIDVPNVWNIIVWDSDQNLSNKRAVVKKGVRLA